MRNLQLVSQAEPPPLPSGELLDVNARRPGELLDVVALNDAAPAFAAKALQARVDPDVAVTVLIELHLMRKDLSEAGLSLPDTPKPTAPSRRLAAAEATYLRALTFRRSRMATAAAPQASIPVRLLPRITRADVEAAAECDVEQAIAWEIAALLEGRTIVELGLLRARRPAV